MFDFIKRIFFADEPRIEFTDPLEIRVNDAINKYIKGFIESDGGKVKLIRVKDNIAYVQLSGACVGCPAQNLTLKGVIQRKLRTFVPEIEDVRLEI